MPDHLPESLTKFEGKVLNANRKSGKSKIRDLTGFKSRISD